MRPYRITVVCLGNICRSPIGEAVLRARVEDAGLTGRVIVDSAGTGDWHIGQGAHPRTIAALDAHNYAHHHVARQITVDWLADIDLVLAMDEANYADVRSMIIRAGSSTELRMMRSFDPALGGLAEPHRDLNVPDPYHGGPEDFDEVLAMIERASGAVVEYATLSYE